MTTEEIHKLMQLLPTVRTGDGDDACRPLPFRHESPASLSTYDPAFRWSYVKAFADLGLPLPEAVTDPVLRRIQEFLRTGQNSDIQLARARAIQLPANTRQRELLQALFLCDEVTVHSVSTLCGLDLETTELYEAVFWNCLERKQDRPYLAYLCAQEQEPFTPDDFPPPEDPGPNLREVAFKTGRTDLVLRAAGLAIADRNVSVPALYEEIEAAYLNSAHLGVLAGKFRAAENPALAPTLRLIGRQEESSEEVTEPGLGPAESAMLVINAMAKHCPPETTDHA